MYRSGTNENMAKKAKAAAMRSGLASFHACHSSVTTARSHGINQNIQGRNELAPARFPRNRLCALRFFHPEGHPDADDTSDDTGDAQYQRQRDDGSDHGVSDQHQTKQDAERAEDSYAPAVSLKGAHD